MKTIALLALLAGTTASLAQKIPKPDAYAKTITATDLKRHLYIIAGPQMEGREATTEGERKAAAYIETEFKRIGLAPGNKESYRQFFPVYQDSLVRAALEINGQNFEPDMDFNVSPASIPAVHAFSQAVFIGQNVPTDTLRKTDLAGRLVILGGANPSHSEIIRLKGAAALFTVSSQYPRKTPASRKGNLTVQFFRSVIGPQQVSLSEEAAKTIIGADYETAKTSKAPQMVSAAIRLEVQKSTAVLQSSNVIGVLPGTDLKDEYLFITAHYDHNGKRGDSVVYYGADDDGSGTVSLIELAEAFARAKKEGKGPRRSIAFMAVSGEEKGLWGSAYYGVHPIYPLQKTTADLNIDMIGRIDPKRTTGDSANYVYIVGDDKLSSELRLISEAANKQYTRLELDYKFNDPDDPQRIYYRSDHYNFARYGVPIIFYFNGTHADYHRPTDTPDKINYPLMAKRAQLVFYTAWEMANRNDMLKRDLKLEKPKGF